ncbi:MAG: fibrobacter succinogenes major paralogous domain-containing protein, partial [Prevotellaceae bacterium]|nr:fibrobacter succinogenes major paralogous domain-containing protein [Prevotellaceae bacterium]
GTVGQTATVTQYGTPRYAASSATWVFGAQTWSDAIQIPGCDKDDFGCSPSDPRCRSHTDQDGLKRYYYNWPYVNRHADTLCPSPWRVPSEADFETLIEAIDYDYETLVRGWDWFGGSANCNRMDNVKGMANSWSSVGAGYVAVELLIVFNKDIFTQNSSSPYGDLVRCVR